MASMDNVSVRIAAYITPIRIVSRKVMALATLLALALPSDASALLKKRMKSVGKAAKGVEAVQTARERGSPAKLQGPRLKFANAFGGLYEVLLAFGRIPAEISPLGERASALATSLFPSGTAFTRLEAVEAWAHGKRLLNRIATEGLEPKIVDLVGPAFVMMIRDATRTLGEAIGAGADQTTTPSSRALSEAVASFQTAVSAYVRALAAEVDEGDPKSVARFFSAVSPIDELRTRVNASGEEEETEEEDILVAAPPVVPTPTTPTPVPPPVVDIDPEPVVEPEPTG